MSNRLVWRRVLPLLRAAAWAVTAVALAHPLAAQQPPAAAAPAPATPRTAAPVDLTGHWVSVVTEEWRWRMVTPDRGDYGSIPLNDAGRKVADTWEPSMDGSCRAYGAAGLMRIPTRLNITWQADDVLKVEADAGQQTRLLQFDASKQPGPRSLQGHSLATWEPIGSAVVQPSRPGNRAAATPPPGGTLKVITTNLREGWLRKNGVPYSESTTLLEYWDRAAFPNGDVWLIVTQVVTDPKYLFNEYTTSMHFKREADGAVWRPSACRQAE
jgi:hypothetical protein